MSSISSVDLPIKSKKDDGTSADLLRTQSYAQALAKFSMECGTPLTIGVQGEWGSGKTSLLNMMQGFIENSEIKTQGRGINLKGCDVYKLIWVNTWEHSLLKSPEECLLSIIEEIINSIAAVDGSWKSTQKAKAALSMLAKGAIRIGATVALGQNVADEIGGSINSANSVRMLRDTLGQAVEALITRDQNPVQRFIIFIDDLDRLDPTMAVMVLELLKNIFSIDHCVFVLAIDYQVVVKGLKSKFGEPNEHNEWEFRAFFDKIIQLPFMMPMGAYDLNGYVENLLQEISFFRKHEIGVLKSSKLSNIVKLTIGANPRSLKRMVNSLSLIVIQRTISNESIAKDLQNNELEIRQLLVALVCIQISFPKLYNLIIRNPIFYEWDDEIVNSTTVTTQAISDEAQLALQRATEISEEDFDEAWEQAVFKILWINGWYKNRIVEVSRALSIIKDKVLVLISSDELKEKLLAEALRLTSVTSVISTEDSMKSDDQDDDVNLSLIALWKEFGRRMLGSKSCFDGIQKKSTYAQRYYSAVPKTTLDGEVVIEVFSSSRQILKITSKRQLDKREGYFMFCSIKHCAKDLEDCVGIKPVFKIGEDRAYQSVSFNRPDDLLGELSAPENLEKRKKVFDWIRTHLADIERIIDESYRRDKEIRDAQEAVDSMRIESTG
jgi:energy-coupling factor transporter ATP-binding protein EcfA2